MWSLIPLPVLSFPMRTTATMGGGGRTIEASNRFCPQSTTQEEEEEEDWPLPHRSLFGSSFFPWRPGRSSLLGPNPRSSSWLLLVTTIVITQMLNPLKWNSDKDKWKSRQNKNILVILEKKNSWTNYFMTLFGYPGKVGKFPCFIST